MSNADAFVAAARSYLGVPFRHQGRDRHGLDCLGLLVCVARDCGLRKDGALLSDWDETDYGHTPDAWRLWNGLHQLLQPVEFRQPGDVVLMRIDGAAQHLGLVGDYSGNDVSLIHAYAPSRKVVEHRLDADWQNRIVQALRFV